MKLQPRLWQNHKPVSVNSAIVRAFPPGSRYWNSMRWCFWSQVGRSGEVEGTEFSSLHLTWAGVGEFEFYAVWWVAWTNGGGMDRGIHRHGGKTEGGVTQMLWWVLLSPEGRRGGGTTHTKWEVMGWIEREESKGERWSRENENRLFGKPGLLSRGSKSTRKLE